MRDGELGAEKLLSEDESYLVKWTFHRSVQTINIVVRPVLQKRYSCVSLIIDGHRVLKVGNLLPQPVSLGLQQQRHSSAAYTAVNGLQ